MIPETEAGKNSSYFLCVQERKAAEGRGWCVWEGPSRLSLCRTFSFQACQGARTPHPLFLVKTVALGLSRAHTTPISRDLDPLDHFTE